MLRYGWVLPLIVIIAIILGVLVLNPFAQRAPFAFTKPTEVTASPAAGVIDAFDLSWRFPSYSVDEVSPRFSVTVDGTEVAEVRGNDGSAGGDRTAYNLRVTGQPCGTPLEVQVTAFSAGADMGRFPSDVTSVTLPCAAPPTPTAAPALTPSPLPVVTPAPTAAPTATPDAPAGLLPPTNLLIEDGGEPGAFIVHWDYPEEGPVVPEGFDVVVDGEVFESTSYEGTDFEYSWYVGDQECGTTVEVEIVATSGEEASSSGTVPAQTGDC